MTGRFPPNGGSSEYGNLMNRLGGIRTLLDEEFAKKLQSGDLSSFAATVASGSAVTTAMVSAGTLPGFTPSPIESLIQQLGTVTDDIAVGAGNILRGGIGGLVNLGKALLGMLLKIIAVTFAILMAIFFIETEIQRISGIINELLSLRDRVTALEEELMGLRDVVNQGFQAVNNNVVAVNNNLEQAQSNIARGIRIATTSTNELIKTETFGVREAVNATRTQLSSQVDSFQSEARAEFNRIEQWQFDNRAAAVATLTVAGVNAPNGLLDRTHTNTNTIKQVVAETASKIEDGFENMKQKFKKVGQMINVGQILDVITLIGVIHNAAMLSRGLLETLFQVVDNGLNAALNAFGVKGLEDEGVDSRRAFTQTVDQIGRTIFGVETWTELKAKWAAANRIVSTGSTLLWSLRDLLDNTQNLAEIAAENSAKVGNSLRRAGQVFDVGAWFPENYSHRTLLHRKLTNLNQGIGNATNLAQVFEELTSTTLEIQENISQINENNENFQKALKDGEKKLRPDNEPVKKEEDEAARKPKQVESVSPGDLNETND
ncbi:MAG TPA: hypothetical protein DCY88_24965 [Cyanobacteria bacterium UBA11372]|nr:hypothetical protein [Cyanobacteria bacterium UBA11372]